MRGSKRKHCLVVVGSANFHLKLALRGCSLKIVGSFFSDESPGLFLQFKGLMGIAPYVENPEETRLPLCFFFARFTQLFEKDHLDICRWA